MDTVTQQQKRAKTSHAHGQMSEAEKHRLKILDLVLGHLRRYLWTINHQLENVAEDPAISRTGREIFRISTEYHREYINRVIRSTRATIRASNAQIDDEFDNLAEKSAHLIRKRVLLSALRWSRALVGYGREAFKREFLAHGSGPQHLTQLKRHLQSFKYIEDDVYEDTIKNISPIYYGELAKYKDLFDDAVYRSFVVDIYTLILREARALPIPYSGRQVDSPEDDDVDGM
jgi:hypothetical protein